MKRVRLSLRTLHSESEDPVIELAPNETIHSITAGLVSGHPTFDVVIAEDITPPKAKPTAQKRAAGPRHQTARGNQAVPPG